MTTLADYETGAAALLKFIQEEIQTLVPGAFQGMIPAEKEPVVAAAGAKRVIDAVAANKATPPTG
jgi:hypothetical protein